MNLTKQMYNYKHNIDVGKYGDFSYEQLICMLDPEEFYYHVTSKEELLQFMQALHIGYSCEMGEQYVPVVFSKLQGKTDGFVMPGDDIKIQINHKLGDMYNIMKECYNTYYPFYLFEVVIHESNHIFQDAAIEAGDFDRLSIENKIGALHYALAQKMRDCHARELIDLDEEKNDNLYAFLDIEDLISEIKGERNGEFFYGNEPCEIAARSNALREAEKLLKIPTLSKSGIKLFKEYILSRKQNNVFMVTENSDTNYVFFMDLLKAEMFTADPEIKILRDKLIEVVDAEFSKQGLPTIGGFEEGFYASAERITKRLLDRAKALDDKMYEIKKLPKAEQEEAKKALQAEQDKLAASYDRYIDRLFLKRIENFKIINKQYYKLFPYIIETKPVTKIDNKDERLGDLYSFEGIRHSEHIRIKK